MDIKVFSSNREERRRKRIDATVFSYEYVKNAVPIEVVLNGMSSALPTSFETALNTREDFYYYRESDNNQTRIVAISGCPANPEVCYMYSVVPYTWRGASWSRKLKNYGKSWYLSSSKSNIEDVIKDNENFPIFQTSEFVTDLRMLQNKAVLLEDRVRSKDPVLVYQNLAEGYDLSPFILHEVGFMRVESGLNMIDQVTFLSKNCENKVKLKTSEYGINWWAYCEDFS